MEQLSQHRKPVVGITIGDAAGIGPEIVLKSLADESVRDSARCVIIGDAQVMRSLAETHGLGDLLVEFSEIAPDSGNVEVFDMANLPKPYDIGLDQAMTGKAAAENIVSAVELWKQGKIDAVATAPISKKAIAMGGYNFPGHTEFLAELTNTVDFRMSFFADKLRVVLLSTHMPLVDAIKAVKADSLSELIRFTDREMSKLLGRRANIAVAGLNPHASEHGMFGTEEANEIEPAIKKCAADGIVVSGPYSPDTIFVRGAKGDFDVIVSLYHDQATIAVKSISFGSAVNVTLGLPLIRTSVDHGTAYDIAGEWKAEAESMSTAIKLAGELARSRQMATVC